MVAGVKRLPVVLVVVLVATVAGVFVRNSRLTESESGIPTVVTFSEHVAPIVHRECTPCHRPGQPGPFSLISYQDVASRGALVVGMTGSKRMPPWPADPTYSSFRDERVLTEREIRLLEAWLEGGLQVGDSTAIPAPPPVADSSFLGTPDVVVPMLTPYVVPGDSTDRFLIIKIPFELPRDTVARAIEFVPGNRSVVHHMNSHLIRYRSGARADVFSGAAYVEDPSNNRDQLETLDIVNDDGSFPNIRSSVANYLPGALPTVYPKGIGGIRLTKKGAFLINEMHYGPTTEAASDQSYFNIFYSSGGPQRLVDAFILGTAGISKIVPPLQIPPDSVTAYHTQYTLGVPISVLTVNPHMHLLGRSMTAFAVTPSQDTIPLIRIPRWDFRWQYFYTYRTPVVLSAGSTIHVDAVFDNTAANPLNPFSPPQMVSDKTRGMKTSDEMMQFIMMFMEYRPGDEDIRLDEDSGGGEGSGSSEGS